MKKKKKLGLKTTHYSSVISVMVHFSKYVSKTKSEEICGDNTTYPLNLWVKWDVQSLKNPSWRISWQASGKDLKLSLLRAWVWSLVRELRSHKLCGMSPCLPTTTPKKPPWIPNLPFWFSRCGSFIWTSASSVHLLIFNICYQSVLCWGLFEI